jgi:hypothetical protein
MKASPWTESIRKASGIVWPIGGALKCMTPALGQLTASTAVSVRAQPARSTGKMGAWPLNAYQAARRFTFSRAFKCGLSFFFALNTRHCTVPIGIALAAAIS